ncbi:MAG: hypothetical protein Q7T26_10950 [Dehalococcoidia bacterium]|nr:hypothetical protein [Dehalococcoidia bacterium]
MSEALAVLAECQKLGATFRVEGDTLRVRAPAPLPGEMLAVLRQHKAEVLAHLRAGATGVSQAAPPSLADALEAMLALGQRLKRGEIAAVRCGISRRLCTACQGVPCLGSAPWEG